MTIRLIIESKGAKIELFSQRTDECQILRCGILATADRKYLEVSSFTVLDMKFWMKEDDNLHSDHL